MESIHGETLLLLVRALGGLARNCLQLLLALTCPNPFAQEPQKCLGRFSVVFYGKGRGRKVWMIGNYMAGNCILKKIMELELVVHLDFMLGIGWKSWLKSIYAWNWLKIMIGYSSFVQNSEFIKSATCIPSSLVIAGHLASYYISPGTGLPISTLQITWGWRWR